MNTEVEEMLKFIFTTDRFNYIKLLYGLGRFNSIRAIISQEKDKIESKHMKHYVKIKGMSNRIKMISIIQIYEKLEDHFIEETVNSLDNDRNRVQTITVP